MTRRDFLMSSAAVAASVSSLRSQPSYPPEKLARIGILSLNFDSILKSPSHPDDPKRTLDFMDFPDMIAERYGVHWVEPYHSHFLSTEPDYFKEFLGRVKKAKSRVSQINLEFGQLNISQANPLRRLELIELSKRWVDHAATFGCPRVMVNPGNLAPPVRATATEALKAINGYAGTRKVRITFEPQHANWPAALEIIKAAGIWANPDCKEFVDDADRSKGLHLMYLMTAGNCHMTTGADIAGSVKIAKEVGFKGQYTIECRHRGDPYEEVKTNIDIVLANM